MCLCECVCVCVFVCVCMCMCVLPTYAMLNISVCLHDTLSMGQTYCGI
jgi:hypothetical protein